jgi:hypothetical protein
VVVDVGVVRNASVNLTPWWRWNVARYCRFMNCNSGELSLAPVHEFVAPASALWGDEWVPFMNYGFRMTAEGGSGSAQNGILVDSDHRQLMRVDLVDEWQLGGLHEWRLTLESVDMVPFD